MRALRRWTVALTCPLIAVAVCSVAAAPAAWGHDVLISTSPADGQRVDAAPSLVALAFSAPVLPIGTAVAVTGPGGDATHGPPEVLADTVNQPLRDALPPGGYRVLWRVTSQDGHPVSGEFGFSVGGVAPAGPAASPTTGSPPLHWPPWVWIASGAVVLAGLLAAALPSSRRRRAARGATRPSGRSRSRSSA